MFLDLNFHFVMICEMCAQVCERVSGVDTYGGHATRTAGGGADVRRGCASAGHTRLRRPADGSAPVERTPPHTAWL